MPELLEDWVVEGLVVDVELCEIELELLLALVLVVEDVVVDDRVVLLLEEVVVVVVTCTGPTTVSDSTRAGKGLWAKLNEFIMLLALITRGATGWMANTESASLMSEANSYTVLSM